MKKCELCKFTARSYCESDEAHLCWSCDDKVHGANFLVARHTRTLLCRNCQSLTPWKASGPNLGRTVSVCDRCVNERKQRREQDESEADNEDFTDADDDLAADALDGGGNGENQVVPLSPTTAPPAVSSSSSSSCTSSQEFVGRLTRAESSVDGMKSVKRTLNENTDSSSGRMSRSRRGCGGGGGDGEAISVDSSSHLKELQTPVNPGSRSASNIKREQSETVDLSSRNIRRRIGGSS